MLHTIDRETRLPRTSAQLRLVATSDLHMQMTSEDFLGMQGDVAGIAKVATEIADLRNDNPNLLLFDNGDLIQGGPAGDVLFQAFQSGEMNGHPLIDAMSEMGYDAFCLGNHDFNFGLDFLRASYADALGKIAFSNHLRTARSTLPDIAQSLLLKRDILDEFGTPHGVTIGVIGLTPPQIMDWDRHHLTGQLTISDMVPAASAACEDLKARGADVVVVLAHIGARQSERGLETGRTVCEAIAQSPGIDAVFAGHTHEALVLDEDLGRAPIVQPHAFGRNLAVIDLSLEQTSGIWSVTDRNARLRDIPKETAEDPRIQRLADPVISATRAHLLRPIGVLGEPVSTFAACAPFDSSALLIADAQRAFARAHLKADLADLPLLSAAGSFHAGNDGPGDYVDIPAGEVTMRDIMKLYPFPNTLTVLRLTGRDVHRWLAQTAQVFSIVRPSGRPGALIPGENPCYRFDILRGVSYRLDLSATGRDRIQDLTLNGVALGEDDPVLVAANTYRAAGGDGYDWLTDHPNVLDLAVPVRDVITDFIANGQANATKRVPSWRLSATKGSSALFRTAARALNHPDIAMMNAAGTTPYGKGEVQLLLNFD